MMSSVQNRSKDTVIVIIGGMGPLAGIDCLRYIMDNCKTDGTDQDNLNTILLSYPAIIESRVDFIMGVSDVNPAESILRLLEPQLHSLKTLFKRILIGASCITFHCPKSYSVFEDGMKSSFPDVELVSLISSTVTFIKNHFSESKRIAIMSTDGTRKAKPFESEFYANGFSPIYLTDSQQAIVTDCIYNQKWGMKSSSFNCPFVHKKLCKIMDELVDAGCDAILLGCTEIPLAITEREYRGVPILNASWMLAYELVRLADASKLKPYS